MSFIISGFQKSTLLDFPDKIACIVFTAGCNFRCGYCHNPELFKNKEPVIDLPAFYDFLKSRKGKLDGVVISGGEPTLQEDLKDFIIQIKSLGFDVKLDTNGTNPIILEELISENLLDYIAMDVKAPLEKYSLITNVNVDISKIQKSINLIMKSDIDYEFRTTVVKEQLSFEDFESIGRLIQGAQKYYFQPFEASKILDIKLSGAKSYSKDEFDRLCILMQKYVKKSVCRI